MAIPDSKRLFQSDVLSFLRSNQLSVVQVTQGQVHFPAAPRRGFVDELGEVAFAHADMGDMDFESIGVLWAVQGWRAQLGWVPGERVPIGYYLFGTNPPLVHVLAYRPFTFSEAAYLKRWRGVGDVGADLELLGLDRSASGADLKQAFRRAAQDTHPDKKGEAQGAEFIRVQQARDRVQEWLAQ